MLVIIDRGNTKWGQRNINFYRLIFTMSMAMVQYKLNGLRDDVLHDTRDVKKIKKKEEEKKTAALLSIEDGDM